MERSRWDDKGERTYADVKLIRNQVATRVRGLDNHRLTSNRPAGEGQLVTSTAPACFTSSLDVHCCIAVCEVVGDCPRRLGGTLVCGAA
jgi:hypothetical protein